MRHIDTSTLWVQHSALNNIVAYLQVKGIISLVDLHTTRIAETLREQHAKAVPVEFLEGGSAKAPELCQPSQGRGKEKKTTTDAETRSEELEDRQTRLSCSYASRYVVCSGNVSTCQHLEGARQPNHSKARSATVVKHLNHRDYTDVIRPVESNACAFVGYLICCEVVLNVYVLCEDPWCSD